MTIKPYTAYKRTNLAWLPQVPEHWELVKAKRIFNKQQRPVRDEDDVVTCFRDGQVTLRKNRREDGFTNSLLEIGYKGIRKNDLVIHGMDAFAGAIGVSDSDGKSTPVYIVCTLKDRGNIWYYCHLIRDMARVGYIQSLAKGIRERSMDFRFDTFGEQFLPTPPPAEQTAIAEFLDHKTTQINTAIAKKQQLIELLKEQKQAMINKAVTEGLEGKTDHWERKKLKYVVSKVGSGITPTGGSSIYQDEGIPLLRSQNIHFDRIDLSEVAFISEDIHDSMSNSKVKAKDVLLNITGGSLGRCFYVDESLGEANVNQHVCILRPNEKVLTKYLYILLVSNIGQTQIWKDQTGSGREGLNFEAIKNFIFQFPTLNEQAAIVAHIERESQQTDTTISRIEREIELLKEYRTTLIANAVTGRIKVI